MRHHRGPAFFWSPLQCQCSACDFFPRWVKIGTNRSVSSVWHVIFSHIGSKSKLIDTMGGMVLCTLRQTSPEVSASRHVSPHWINKSQEVHARKLYASMLDRIADFLESRLIPWRDFAVFNHRHTKINWVIKQLRT